MANIMDANKSIEQLYYRMIAARLAPVMASFEKANPTLHWQIQARQGSVKFLALPAGRDWESFQVEIALGGASQYQRKQLDKTYKGMPMQLRTHPAMNVLAGELLVLIYPSDTELRSPEGMAKLADQIDWAMLRAIKLK